MGIKMSVKTKMDTLDFVIKILIEHEKKLDILIERLENNTQYIENIIKKIELNNYYKLEPEK
jgi:hypothetical protein